MVGNIHRDYFLICIITGLIRGAVRIIVSLVATIVTLVIVFFATPYVSQTIEKYTPLDDMIRQKVVSTMADAATSAVSGGDSYSDKGGLTEEAVKRYLRQQESVKKNWKVTVSL